MNTTITRRQFGLVATAILFTALSNFASAVESKENKLKRFRREFRRYYRWYSANLRRHIPHEPTPPNNWTIETAVFAGNIELESFLRNGARIKGGLFEKYKKKGIYIDELLVASYQVRDKWDDAFEAEYGKLSCDAQAKLAMLYYGDLEKEQPESWEDKEKILLETIGSSLFVDSGESVASRVGLLEVSFIICHG